MATNAEDALREELQKISHKLKTTEFNLEAQRVEVKQLNNLYFRLKDDYNKLVAEKKQVETNLEAATDNYNRSLVRIQRLRHRLRAAQNDADFEPIMYNKVWTDLRCALSKRKRKKLYRSVIDRSIRQILECSRVRVFLTLGNETIALQWSEQELKDNRDDLFNAGYIFPQDIVPLKRNGAGGGGGPYALDCERQDDQF